MFVSFEYLVKEVMTRVFWVINTGWDEQLKIKVITVTLSYERELLGNDSPNLKKKYNFIKI